MLITRIKASNFYGIKDPIEVAFIEGGEKEKVGYVNKGKERISLISGFYGSNASGKSTVLNAIDTVIRIMLIKQQDYVINPGGIKEETVIAFPNFSSDAKDKPIILEIDFVFGSDDNKYNYLVSITNEGKEISKEVLCKNGKEIFSRNDHKVSLGNQIEKIIGDAVAKNIVAPKKSSFVSVLLDENSDISVFSNLKTEMGVSELKEINNKICFITDKRSVQMGQNNINGLLAFAVNYLNDTKTQDEKLGAVNSVVKYFEPSFESLIIKKGSDNNPINKSFSFTYEAKYTNFYKNLGIMELSAGTRELVAYISNILKIIKNGGIVVYDETSKYYHPDMEIAILNLFKDKDINQHNAQIFFSSHNHETFDLLQNNQAHILEKKDNGIAVSKVSDYDVRERDNVKRAYRLGSLGGVPDTIDFNRIINNLL
ncbi:ATP-binding protein [Patescibacteria group bacterium]|nr:ATP-binding protein [Patescibacteria group bacterium]